MPRIAEGRPPAEPTSEEQWDRYRRIIRAAIEHGSRQPMERVQMSEVAKDAGVAIATLYRYFPSKTQLFASVLKRQIGQLDAMVNPREDGVAPDVAVSELLIGAGRALLQFPVLARTMLHANMTSISLDEADLKISEDFRAMLMKVAGLPSVTTTEYRLMRLIEQTWYGILISALNGVISAEDVEADTRLACARLLADLGTEDREPAVSPAGELLG